MDRMHLNIGAMLARAALRNTVQGAQNTARSVAKDVASVARAHQRQLVGAGIGAVTGGGAGYLGASRGADEEEQGFRSRRLRSTLIGSAIGGALGGGIGHVTRPKQAPPAAAPRAPRPPKSERRAAQRRIGGGATQVDELDGFDTKTRMEIRKELYNKYRDAEREPDPASIASPLARAVARIAIAHAERDRIRLVYKVLQERADRYIARGDDPNEVREWLEAQRVRNLNFFRGGSDRFGYRHREKIAAFRDRLAVGADLIDRRMRALRD
jgi:hypothetical protein